MFEKRIIKKIKKIFKGRVGGRFKKDNFENI